MRDRIKEEELRCSMDPKYAHLNSDLHVEISTIAPPAEAYARMAYAMAEIRKYLIPDSNDGIRQEQLRELMNNNSASGNNGVMGISSGLANCSLNNDHESKSYNKNMNSVQTRLKHGGGVHDQNKMHQHGYRQQPPPHHQQPSYVNHNNLQKSPMVPRQKVMSILENARQAMEENYRYRMYDNHSQFDQQNFDNTNYAYGHMHGPPQQIQHQQGHAPHLNHPLAQTS
uniref:Uncharacterized protein n=1 Tax=Megaselia scalaris TaxID=36166 RepID=T1GRD2_MEGSC